MYPNGPASGAGGTVPDFVQYAHHDAWWSGPMHVVPLVLFVILIGVAVWAVLRLTTRNAQTAAAVGAPVGPPQALPPRDPAQEELRVRYARGELDRDEYLQRSTDLGGPVGPVGSGDPGPSREAPTQPEE